MIINLRIMITASPARLGRGLTLQMMLATLASRFGSESPHEDVVRLSLPCTGCSFAAFKFESCALWLSGSPENVAPSRGLQINTSSQVAPGATSPNALNHLRSESHFTVSLIDSLSLLTPCRRAAPRTRLFSLALHV